VAAETGLIDLDDVSEQDERLRDVPRDAGAVAGAVEQARAALGDARHAGDVAAQQYLLGYLGNACRLLGRTDDAIAYLTEGLRLARAAGDVRRSVVATIRLGEAYRCRDEYSTAMALFRDAQERTRATAELAELEDFALQHLGKCLLDQDDCAGALPVLERALALRQAKGNPQLVTSTERALALVRSRALHSRR
jgi:tetratricopeptide (TPR) repeat protein